MVFVCARAMGACVFLKALGAYRAWWASQCTQPLCATPQAERVTKMLAIAQQSATDAKERCSTLEAELRRMQGRRDALVDENTALSHKVRPLAWPWRD